MISDRFVETKRTEIAIRRTQMTYLFYSTSFTEFRVAYRVCKGSVLKQTKPGFDYILILGLIIYRLYMGIHTLIVSQVFSCYIYIYIYIGLLAV